MRKILSVLFLIFTSVFILFAQEITQNPDIELLSPVEGVWGNKQMLIINDADKTHDYYFSLNGSDPEISGFAYDGPILLDITGQINLRIKRSDGAEKKVEFSVIPDSGFDFESSTFISEFLEKGELNYICGNELKIPENLYFSFTDRLTDLQKGYAISVNSNNSVAKKLPCLLVNSTKEKQWRFIINIIPDYESENFKNEYPFKINDWKELIFTDKKLIYRVDKNYWHGYDKTEILDRSIDHTIYWQSIDYKEGNPVESFVLPAKPSYVAHKIPLREQWYTIKDNPDYKMGLIDENNNAQYLSSSVGADTFPGDHISGNLKIGIFYKSIYQGKMNQTYNIDKSVPEQPVITPDSNVFFIKNKLIFSIDCNKGNALAVSISNPYEIKDDGEEITSENLDSKEIEMNPFVLLNTDTFKAELLSGSDSPVYYRVKAYAYNELNQSLVSEYSVVIGQNIFYLCENSSSPVKNGTKANPFNNLDDCLNAVSECDYGKIKISGAVHLNKPFDITSNCEFIGDDEGEIYFENNGCMNFVNSNVRFTDLCFVVENSTANDNVNSIIKAFDSDISMNDCLISANFQKTGNIFDLVNTSFSCSDLTASTNSENFSSVMTAINSDINISNSKINNISTTSTMFTFKNSKINFSDNDFMIIGNIGRAFELFSTTGKIENNAFRCNLEDLSKSKAISKDEASDIINNGNEYNGF